MSWVTLFYTVLVNFASMPLISHLNLLSECTDVSECRLF
jgi:hypothetical protein